jgi:hypothetical protein
MIIPNSYGNLPDTDFFIYSACDEHYFDEFGKYFIASAQANAGAAVHLHLFNPRPDQLEFCNNKSISVTHEHVPLELFAPAANLLEGTDSPMKKSTLTAMVKGNDVDMVDRIRKTYYACARFIRLQAVAGSVLALDIDAVIRRPIAKLVQQDVHLHKIFGKKARCLAGAVYINDSVNGHNFIKEYAQALRSTLGCDNIYWGVDQDVLQQVANNYDIGQLPISLIDWNMQPDSAVWTAKGTRKSLDVFVNEQKKYSA